MEDHSPDSQDAHAPHEHKKDHIIPQTLHVEKAQRSRVGTTLLYVFSGIIVVGLIYIGILYVNRVRTFTPNQPAPAIQEDDAVTFVDLNDDGKIENELDPFARESVQSGQLTGEMADFGDAPEETSVIGQVDYELFGSFPTLLDTTLAGSVRHLEKDRSMFLGMRKFGDGVTLESDGETVNFDQSDDGVILPIILPCQLTSLQVEVTIPKDLEPPYYLNALADFDGNGRWASKSVCRGENDVLEVPEWFIANMDLSELYDLLPGESRRLIIPDFLSGPRSGKMWMRYTLTTEPIVSLDEQGWDGSGYFIRGETEDYLVDVFADSESADAFQEDGTLPTTSDDDLLVDDETLDGILPSFQDILDEPSFLDVPEDAWFAPYASYVSRHGIMKGDQNNNFLPSGGVTRSEVVTIALRLHGEELDLANADTDEDGLLDLEEVVLGTDPQSSDSDSDGQNDYREVMNYSDPLSSDGLLESLPLPLDTIWQRHWSRSNVVRALMLGYITSKSFGVEQKFQPDSLATTGFALNVLMNSSGLLDTNIDPLALAQELGLIDDAESFDGNIPLNRAVLSKFVTELGRRI